MKSLLVALKVKTNYGSSVDLPSFHKLRLYMVRFLVDGSGGVGHQRLTSHLIRFMAHLVLFLRSAGLCDVGDELGVRLVLKYVEVLITSKMTDLVATYTAHLPVATQVMIEEYRGCEQRKSLAWISSGVFKTSVTWCRLLSLN